LALSRRYEATTSEPRWQQYWQEQGIFRFNPDSGRRLYAIDTPPPTVSGMIHMGHVFSYVQAEAVARFRRMRGEEVFYPFCFDDNGLPSERFTERTLGVRAHEMPRREFVRLCLQVTRQAEQGFRDLWTRLGFSCDWDEAYTTIDPAVQRISQRSFLDLFGKGRVYRKSMPTLWCPECRTAVAQAETEDKELPSVFHDLLFSLEGGGTIPIATTRPELLPACVAVFRNPSDQRWAALEGRLAVVPLFGRAVPILADDRVSAEKGSGLVMCCTFGDTTDISWWEQYGLDLRIALEKDGKMNSLAGALEGMPAARARNEMVGRLQAEGLLTGGKPIVHAVNVHERCGTPLEYLVSPQWFIRILDLKEDLLRRGAEVNWYPEMFRVRYDHWVENLRWDWCISRQRYFGVPFPLWYCTACGEPVMALPEALPVDPLEDDPGRPCPGCGSSGFTPEADVMDTWATSSLTPQINARWGEADARPSLMPMGLRPQAHDIIRTWAFYSIVKAHLHSDSIPWRDVMISGHALNPSREKMSKSRGNVAGDPLAALGQYSADELRYWACSSRLGTDVVFSEEVLGLGRRLVTKLWNATRFASQHLEDFDPSNPVDLHPFDKWILARAAKTAAEATSGFEEYEYSTCMRETETFFWSALCDNYLEIVKGRLYGSDPGPRRAAQKALYDSLYISLRLFAPVLVHVTEELYQEVFRKLEGHVSLHIAPWPDVARPDPEELRLGDAALSIVEAARKFKSEGSLSMAAQLGRIRVTAPAGDLRNLRSFENDLLGVTRAAGIEWLEGEILESAVEGSAV
jgi:valyl-tRNA synthetase